MVPSIKLWIVGTDKPVLNHSWSLKGVYTSEALARLACTMERDFYAPASVDDFSEDESAKTFDGITYPLRGKP